MPAVSPRVTSEVYGASISIAGFHILPNTSDAPPLGERANGYRISVEHGDGSVSVELTRIHSTHKYEHDALKLHVSRDELPVVLSLFGWCCDQLQQMPTALALLPQATDGRV
jgi:hypothetical protein